MSTRLFIRTVLNQHAEETALLLDVRTEAVGAPHYALADLYRLDTRLDAHHDGLRIAGDAGWEIAAKELAWKEPGEVFAAVVLAFESGIRERIDVVLGVAAPDRALARGAISALGWLELDRARPHIEALVRSQDPALRRIGLRAAAVHRWSLGTEFETALRSAEPTLVSAAARAAGELGEARLVSACRVHGNSEDFECRFWTCWSLGLAGDAVGVPFLQEVAVSQSPRALPALNVAARRLSRPDALAWCSLLASQPDTLRTAVVLAGRVGDPELVPWLLEQMSVPELARPAGEAFTFITGVDLAYQDLEMDRPEGFESGPTENPENPDVAMDPDEDLPWPDPVLVEKWWSQNRGSFRPGVRHLVGQPIKPASLQQALRTAKQRQRAAAALELRMLEPDRPLFEVRAPAFRQKRALGA